MLYSVNKTQLNVIEAGSGPLALVFLHYFGGSALEWQTVMNSLADQYRCIAVDLRGHGDSEAPTTSFSVETMVEDIRQLLQRLNIQRFVLIGHSMSGKVALALASQQPKGLQSLVLFAPSPPVPEPIPEDDRQEMLATHGQREAAEQTATKITVKSISESARNQIITDNLRTSEVAWNAWLMLGSKEDISAQMTAIQVPVAILAGSADKALSPEVQPTKTLPYLKGATLEIAEGVGHLLPWETPDDVIRFIRKQLPN
ncbi:alpha/beta hydrolase [Spirosoma flavus]